MESEFYVKEVQHSKLAKGESPAETWTVPTVFFKFKKDQHSGTTPFEVESVATAEHVKNFPGAWSNFVKANPAAKVHVVSELPESGRPYLDADHVEVAKENHEASEVD